MPSHDQTFDFRDNAKPGMPAFQRTDSAGFTSIDRQRQDSRRSLRAGPPSPRIVRAIPQQTDAEANSPTRRVVRHAAPPAERPESVSSKAQVGPANASAMGAILGNPDGAPDLPQQRFVKARVVVPAPRERVAPKVDPNYRVVAPWHTE